MAYFVLKCEIKIGKGKRRRDDGLTIEDAWLANAPADVPTEPDEEDP